MPYKIKYNCIIWLTASKHQRDLILIQSLYISFASIVLEVSARLNWLFIIKSIIKSFTQAASSLNLSLLYFKKYFYKKIREVQSIIPVIGSKIKGFNKFKFLQQISPKFFIYSLSFMSVFKKNAMRFTAFITLLKTIITTEFNTLSNIISNFGLELKFPIDTSTNFYIFLFYLKLYELEETLQWLNWAAFYINIQAAPYKLTKNKSVAGFIIMLNKVGYQSWYVRYFNTNKGVKFKHFKLKKKWRFWRDFRRSLLFDKAHIFIKLSWLFNHKRLLSHQYKDTYALNIQKKLKCIYKKKISKPRLFAYLISIEFRIDILSMRIFRIKSIKLALLLIRFGYITINLIIKNQNYVAKKGDFFFGWFILKNVNFFRKFRVKLYGNHKAYTNLEFDLAIHSFICLSFPVKYPDYLHSPINIQYDKNRLVSSRFIKYTYLKTY